MNAQDKTRAAKAGRIIFQEFAKAKVGEADPLEAKHIANVIFDTCLRGRELNKKKRPELEVKLEKQRKTKALSISRRMFGTNLNQSLLRQAKLWGEATDELEKIALKLGIWEDPE